MVFQGNRRSPESHDSVALVFVDDSLGIQNHLAHLREVVVEETYDSFGFKAFGQGCEIRQSERRS